MGSPKLGSESKAIRALRDLAKGPDGGFTFLQVLQADPAPLPGVKRFIELAVGERHLEARTGELAVEAKCTVSDLFFAYSRGIRAIGHAEAVTRLSEMFSTRLGDAIESLLDQAVTHEIPCQTCQGTGKPLDGKGLAQCWVCAGSGKAEILPPMWEFAQQRVYELAGLAQPADKSGITISQTNVQTKQAAIAIPSHGFMEKLATLSDELVHAQRKQIGPAPIEAQLIERTDVQPSDYREATGSGRTGSEEGLGQSQLPPDAL